MSEKEKKDKSENPNGNNKSLAERTSIFEWIVAAAGLGVVLFSLGFVSYKAVVSEDMPPILSVKSTATKQLPNGYLVEFTVKNEGDRTAANVIIEGKLSNGEEKTITLNYIAPESEQVGGLFFENNPLQNNLEIKAIGYESP